MSKGLAGLDALIYLQRFVVGGETVCVMCSEGDYRKCHRSEMLEPSFSERGLDVHHITY